MQLLYLENGHPFLIHRNTEDNPNQEWAVCLLDNTTIRLVKKELIVNFPYYGIMTAKLSNQLRSKVAEFVIGRSNAEV